MFLPASNQSQVGTLVPPQCHQGCRRILSQCNLIQEWPPIWQCPQCGGEVEAATDSAVEEHGRAITTYLDERLGAPRYAADVLVFHKRPANADYWVPDCVYRQDISRIEISCYKRRRERLVESLAHELVHAREPRNFEDFWDGLAAYYSLSYCRERGANIEWFWDWVKQNDRRRAWVCDGISALARHLGTDALSSIRQFCTESAFDLNGWLAARGDEELRRIAESYFDP